MGTIERLAPLITVEQLIELVKLAVSSKTNEIELEVARAIRAYYPAAHDLFGRLPPPTN